MFQNKRYTSAGEGAWRIFCNEICEQWPPSTRLQIHLQGQQTVYFDTSNKDQSIESIRRSETTKLTASFIFVKLMRMHKNYFMKMCQNFILGTLIQRRGIEGNGKTWMRGPLMLLDVYIQLVQ